ncbi:hypothetical protein PNK_p0134 (plasmid) [Candidatus Protochlamydia naegleriophila]|uniref:Uncharacterized protein n=1 Tax=Candidatus Protochlamydia naegleriophila TaxID=389348 RepID=A0A0U5JH24_9BACT|nr:hypothetical protein [Candidatus Protochlamydia naegleriophila]CUI18186.1 hypothetical protein PNK_p0134 [Candidatus Protochlamydia naegleriophila]
MYVQSQSSIYSSHQLTESQNVDPTFSEIYKNVRSIISSTSSDDEKSVTITRMFMQVINNCETSLFNLTRELRDSQETIKRLKQQASLKTKGVVNYESQILLLEKKIKELSTRRFYLSYENKTLRRERKKLEQSFDHFKSTVSTQRQQDALAFSELEIIAEKRKHDMEILSEQINEYSARVNCLVRDNTHLQENIHNISTELNLSRDWSLMNLGRLAEVTREKDVLQVQVNVLEERIEQVTQERTTEVQVLRDRLRVLNIQTKVDEEIKRMKIAFINHSTIQTYRDCKGTANYLANKCFPSWFTDLTPPHEDLSSKPTTSKNIFTRMTDSFLSIGRAKYLEELIAKEALEYPNISEKKRLDQLMYRIGYGCLIRPEEEYLR